MMTTMMLVQKETSRTNCTLAELGSLNIIITALNTTNSSAPPTQDGQRKTDRGKEICGKHKIERLVCGNTLQLRYFYMFGWVLDNFTSLSDPPGLVSDAMKCSGFLSSSKCLLPFQVGHLLLNQPANEPNVLNNALYTNS